MKIKDFLRCIIFCICSTDLVLLICYLFTTGSGLTPVTVAGIVSGVIGLLILVVVVIIGAIPLVQCTSATKREEEE